MKQLNANLQNVRKGILFFFVAILLTFVTDVRPVNAAAKIKETEYEGNGKVEINFSSRVEYKNLKVTVKDQKGKKVKVHITETDDDELEFKIVHYKQGAVYSYKISGVRQKGEKKYSTLSGKIQLPKSNGNVPVKEIEYDARDQEVSFEFETKVTWQSPKVVITDDKTDYVLYIDEKDKDEIEVAVKKLKKGVTYQYTISGIKKKGDKKFTIISGTFMP